MDVSLINPWYVGVAFYFIGIKWDLFWKRVDYLIRDWVENHKALGFIVEFIVDMMHHTPTALILIAVSQAFYPTLYFFAIAGFGFGMLTADLPKEKERIFEAFKAFISGMNEAVEEAIDEITEKELDKASEELLKTSVEEFENELLKNDMTTDIPDNTTVTGGG